ncbi:MAG TPA: diaminopimelate epimerase, partial [Myxococcota bacterium]|nr:diaminopimelate epimerase [Myxococcota bacterium]
NDYLVVDPRELDFALTKRAVRALCDRHRGVGADGVLALAPARRADFGVRIYNPDGSEAEKSGNGLRIFGRYLFASGRTRRTSFTVATRGGVVALELQLDRRGDASRARVAMGRATFRPSALPCTLRVDELVDRPIRVGAGRLRFTGVSVGNPHCVIFRARGAWSARDLRSLGPALESHPWFPRRVNVQLARVRGPHALDVLVWERGAGETQASGSSACAAACAGVKRGWLRSPVRVRMPGGALDVEVSPDFDLTLAGPVEAVASGRLADAFVRHLSARVTRSL